MALVCRRKFLAKLVAAAAVGASVESSPGKPFRIPVTSAVWGWDGEDMVVNVRDGDGGTWVWSTRAGCPTGRGEWLAMMPTLVGPRNIDASPIPRPTILGWSETLRHCFGHNDPRHAFGSDDHCMIVKCDEDGIELVDLLGDRRRRQLCAMGAGKPENHSKISYWYWKET